MKTIKIENRQELLEEWQHVIDEVQSKLPPYIRLEVWISKDELRHFAEKNGYLPKGSILVDDER